MQRGFQNWNEFKIDLNTLCNCDDALEIKIEFFKSVKSGDHKLIDRAFTDLGSLKSNNFSLTFKNGSASFEMFEIRRQTSFLDYVFGGCSIGLQIAIDFTLSNGKPT